MLPSPLHKRRKALYISVCVKSAPSQGHEPAAALCRVRANPGQPCRRQPAGESLRQLRNRVSP